MDLKQKDWLDKAFEEKLKEGKLIVGLPLESSFFYEKFNQAGETYLMEKLLFSNDYNLLSEKLTEWKNKAKNENQKELLDKLINALIRIFIYNLNMENNLKSAIAISQYNKSQNDWLKEKISDIHKENLALRKENEYLTDEKYE